MDRVVEYSPSIQEIVAARERIAGIAVRTPLVESPALSRRFGIKVYLKLECFQPTRVFKIRGAYNKLAQVDSGSVVAASSGNHGLAVAYSSRLLGKRCTVVVPETAIKEKVDAIAEYGAEVVRFGKFSVERERRAQDIATRTAAAFIHPYDDPAVVAGQGTCGLEIMEQLGECDAILVPVGGGGLISGICVAVKSLRPECRVYSVEPAGAAKLSSSLKAGAIRRLESPHSIADGLLPNSVGELAFKVCKTAVEDSFEVTDEQIVSAMRLLARDAHIFAEPSGAASVAALLNASDIAGLGRKVVCVVSGGNVSLDLLKKVIEG
jgi:threonine dehydratase